MYWTSSPHLFWPCSSRGLPGHHGHPQCRCALTTPFQLDREYIPFYLSTAMPFGFAVPHIKPRAGPTTFCCTFLRVASTGRYPATCSVKLGLSSQPLWVARMPFLLWWDDFNTKKPFGRIIIRYTLFHQETGMRVHSATVYYDDGTQKARHDPHM